jgi:hypothetical protein
MSPKNIPADEQTVFAPSPASPAPPDLRFLHYNDVYHVEAGSAEPVGGVGRFQTVVNYYREDEKFKDQPKLVTFFSGDAFNPSLESSVTKGALGLGVYPKLTANLPHRKPYGTCSEWDWHGRGLRRGMQHTSSLQ